jgi:hypothetical protein
MPEILHDAVLIDKGMEGAVAGNAGLAHDRAAAVDGQRVARAATQRA